MTETLLKRKKPSKEFVDVRLVERIWSRMCRAVEEDERILEKAREKGKSRVRLPKGHWKRVIDEISEAARGSINFYPSEEDIGECRKTVVFDAVSWHKGQVVKKPLKLVNAIELLVKHSQGWCWGKTQRAIVYTDDWNRSTNQWKMNLDVVRSNGCQVSIVLVTGDSGSKTLTVLNF